MMLDDIIEPFEQDDSCLGEYKVLAYSSANRNGQIISRDAFKDQDGKTVPLKWGSGKDAFVIGTAELDSRDDGIHAKCTVTCSKEDYINHYLTKPQRILRKIKKWLGIVSPTEERWPWEDELAVTDTLSPGTYYFNLKRHIVKGENFVIFRNVDTGAVHYVSIDAANKILNGTDCDLDGDTITII